MILQYMSHMFMAEAFPFWIKRFRHDSDRLPHSHDFVELVYVEAGTAIHEFEGIGYEIGPGDVFIMNPGEVHTYRIAQGNSLDIINCLFTPALIDASLLQELKLVQELDFLYVLPFLDPQLRFRHRLHLDAAQAGKLLQVLEGMIEEQKGQSPGYESLIRMKLIEVLVLLSRYDQRQRTDSAVNWSEEQLRVRRLYGYLERHAYGEIQVDEIARLFHMSSRHLNRLLRKEYGHSVMEIVQHIRLERAKRLLRETDLTVLEISTMVGYESSSFFNRLFMRNMQCTPTAYRMEQKSVK